MRRGGDVNAAERKRRSRSSKRNSASTTRNYRARKDQVIVSSWNYSTKNWIYVVLSRVRTMSGLYLCHPLDETRPFPVDDKLLVEESRLARMEEDLMEHRQNNM